MAFIYKDGTYYNRSGSEGGASLPAGGTTGQVLAKKSNTDGDVEWITSESGHAIKDNGTSVADESSLNFTDFDISDDATNEETDIKSHRLTSSEMADICSPLPGAPYRQIEYSTEEQVIGKWIDGKPLYQKTISFTIGNTVTQNVSHAISNLDFGQIIWNFIINANDINAYTYSFLDSNWFKNIDVGKTDISFAKTAATHFDTWDAYVTIQYTKTTD